MLASDILPAPFEVMLRGRAGTALAVAEVHDYRWAEQQQQTYLDDRHCIDMVLSHRPPGARGRFLDEGTRTPHQIGPVIFLPGRHAMQSEWSAGEQRSVCCTIDPALMEDESNPAPDHLGNALDIRDPFVRATMERLAAEALAPGFASGLVVESLCQAILIDLQRSLREPTRAAGGRIDLRRFDELVAVAGPLPPIGVLAAHFGMSARNFTRLFRASTGRSVAAYAADRRGERAAILLATPGPLIKEIAWTCGFANTAAFSAAFRKRTGLTPREFRRSRLS